MNWLEDAMLVEGNINPEDLALFEIVDTAEEVVSYMLDYYRTRQLAPNF
jgi:predicted Rossmann-fold nucleotide-binding protein